MRSCRHAASVMDAASELTIPAVLIDVLENTAFGGVLGVLGGLKCRGWGCDGHRRTLPSLERMRVAILPTDSN